MENILIRRATLDDAEKIHDAHMLSIKTVCSKDHSPEEIAAWGGRSFNHLRWKEAIELHCVWVVESAGAIEGYAHLQVSQELNGPEGYVEGLYLTSKVLGQKIGSSLAKLIINEVRLTKAKKIRLHSTLTAHEFYLKLGFQDEGPMTTVKIAGQPIRCFPMCMELHK